MSDFIIPSLSHCCESSVLASLTAQFLCRIEGMKAENSYRERQGLQVAYVANNFEQAEDEFRVALVKAGLAEERKR